jgi:hypothetical protein
MTTRLQTQALLDRARTMQAENDKSLIFAREDVDNWLNTVCRACYREQAYLQDKGDIADGEIQVPWDLLQEAIGRLRAAQAQRDNLKSTMEGLIADLADDTL